MGDEGVTWGDVDRSIRIDAMVRGVPPKAVADAARRRDPFFLWSAVDGILQRRRLLREGERLGLTPGLDELLEAWRAHPELSPLLARRLDEVESRLQEVIGLSVADVYEVLRAEIVERRWLDGVVSEIVSERLWSEYQWRERTVTLDAVGIPNVPSSRELEDFIARQAALIEAEYGDHISRYTIRPTADVWRLSAVAAERRRLEEVRGRLLEGAPVAELSLEGVARERLERVGDGVVPEAFRQEVGEIGAIVEEDGSVQLLVVEAFQPPVRRPLDDLLRREIASNLLTRQRILDRAREVSEQVRAALVAGDDTALAALGEREILRRRSFGPLQQEEDGLVPGIGRAPELSAWLFGEARVGEVAEPTLVDGMVWVVELVAREEPTAAQFEVDRERFRAELEAIIRATAWDAFWARCLEAEPIRFLEGSGEGLPTAEGTH